MKIDLVNQENSTVRSIDISDSVFKAEINDGLIHELVTSYRSNGRSATKNKRSSIHRVPMVRLASEADRPMRRT